MSHPWCSELPNTCGGLSHPLPLLIIWTYYLCRTTSAFSHRAIPSYLWFVVVFSEQSPLHLHHPRPEVHRNAHISTGVALVQPYAHLHLQCDTSACSPKSQCLALHCSRDANQHTCQPAVCFPGFPVLSTSSGLDYFPQQY